MTTEMDKLQSYLEMGGYRFTRTQDDIPIGGIRDQIVVFRDGKRVWDALCSRWSYGGTEGLLEVMGEIVDDSDDCVKGFLTAKDIVAMMEREDKHGDA